MSASLPLLQRFGAAASVQFGSHGAVGNVIEERPREDVAPSHDAPGRRESGNKLAAGLTEQVTERQQQQQQHQQQQERNARSGHGQPVPLKRRSGKARARMTGPLWASAHAQKQRRAQMVPLDNSSNPRSHTPPSAGPREPSRRVGVRPRSRRRDEERRRPDPGETSAAPAHSVPAHQRRRHNWRRSNGARRNRSRRRSRCPRRGRLCHCKRCRPRRRRRNRPGLGEGWRRHRRRRRRRLRQDEGAEAAADVGLCWPNLAPPSTCDGT